MSMDRDGAASNLEWLEQIRKGAAQPPPVYTLLGIQVVDFAPGSATVRLVAHPRLGNPAGAVHGGVLATALDVAMALAVDTELTDGGHARTVDMSVRFLDASPANAASLLAIGKVLSMRSRLAFADATIRTDCGVLLATSSGVFSVPRSNKASRLASRSPVVSLDNSLKSE